MDQTLNLLNVGHAIELAVAPVFLLTGIGAILSVLTNRLGRSVDRFRALNERADPQRSTHQKEIRILGDRVKYIHWAITLCTTAALFVSLVIVTLFVGASMEVNVSLVITVLFSAAMLSLIVGLLCFLREIVLAIRILRLERKSGIPLA